MDRYGPARRRVAAALARWNTGAVTLLRTTREDPEIDTPWVPGDPTTDVYELNAVVKGVAEKYIDGTTVVASDLMATVAPRARHTLHNDAAADGAVVDLTPTMTDVIRLDGVAKAVKRIDAVPAAGDPVTFRIFLEA